MNRLILVTIIIAARWCFALDRELIKDVSLQWDARQVQTLQNILLKTEKDGLAVQCLENKVREGLAKNKAAESIIAAVEKRDSILHTLVQKNSHLTSAAQTKLLYDAEKTASAKPQQNQTQSVVPGRMTKGIEQKPGTIPENNVPEKAVKNARQSQSIENSKSTSENKIEKYLEKQEQKLNKIEQKQDKHEPVGKE